MKNTSKTKNIRHKTKEDKPNSSFTQNYTVVFRRINFYVLLLRIKT